MCGSSTRAGAAAFIATELSEGRRTVLEKVSFGPLLVEISPFVHPEKMGSWKEKGLVVFHD